MKAINRKLVRNVLDMKGQAIAIALVIASGVAMSVMSLSTLKTLDGTRAAYYERYRFAQVFAGFKRGPRTLESRVQHIPGVARADLRIVQNVNLIVPGLPEPAVGKLISIPDHGTPKLNQLYLRRGRLPEPGRLEVLVGESFANEHSFQPGDSVEAILNGRLRELTMVGIVLSPEYIVEMDPGDMLPDFKRFGLFWVPETEMEAAFDMEGAANDLSLTLMRGASEDDVIRRLDNLLDDWGGVGSYGRDEHMSHRFITDELAGLEAMGLVTPIIFMAVAAFLLNMVMTRVIAMQREQIAALKAFGYYNLEVGWHYCKMVTLIVVAGVVAGTLFGVWMGHGMAALYAAFFKFPIFYFQFDLQTAVITAVLSVAAALVGTLNSLRAASQLPPAEAMRPAPPGKFSKTIIERMGLQRLLSPAWRMIIRQLHRQPLKAVFSVLGISAAVGILVLGNFMNDAMDFLIDFQFRQVQRQDLQVSLFEPTGIDVVNDFQHITGVRQVEAFRGLAVRLRNGARSHRTAIQGMGKTRQLYRVVNQNGVDQDLSRDGLVVSDALARKLNSRVGDSVVVEVLEGERPVTSARIVGTIDDLSGLNAFASRDFVNRITREGPRITGAWMTVDAEHLDDVYASLKETPYVVGVNSKEATIDSFTSTVADSQLQMQSFVIGFAIVIAAGVVYNTARITLSERDRELATMRVLGFTHAEVSVVLLGELALLTLAAIPVGLAFGYAMVWLTTTSLATDLFRIPLVISTGTFAQAAIIVLLAAFASGWMVRRRLYHLDLFAVLKGKE
ncbi:FtsX-like permease family protein [Fuerstiella marisgermanici]|nr:ABC transporter permease [Fuerstiella marisgermanici]